MIPRPFLLKSWNFCCTCTVSTGWRTKCHIIDCAHNTFLLLQKHLISGTELILIGWKIVPNEEHVQCDHHFASQRLANEPLHSSHLFDTSLQKARGTTSLCGPCAARFLKTCVEKLWRMQGFVCKRLWGKTVVTLNMFFIRLETIFQPMRINSVPDFKCFCYNKNVLRAQSKVWHFVRHPVYYWLNDEYNWNIL